MCGIVGAVGKKINRNHLNSLSNRGPDQRGILKSGKVYFGHTRLSILDVNSQSSKQPMTSEKGNLLIFNGEIYNFLELKNELKLDLNENVGDTEVLMACLDLIGVEKTVDKLIGMFAFAYYDKSKEQLFLVRDRLGQKPLYYCDLDESFSFSSDLTLIRKINKDFNFTLNNKVIPFYFSAFYIPSPHTIYSQIYSLKQGTILIYSLNSKKIIKQKTYWAPNVKKRSTNFDIERFKNTFKDATKIRLRSDVPLGSFLSGGIDSTYVVKTINDLNISDIETYTAAVKDALDETKFAKKVSKYYKVKNTVVDVEKSELKIAKIRELIRSFGQPFADSSILPTNLVCELISNHVTVAMSGDGSDEIFMGYDKYHSKKLFEEKVFRNNNLQFLKLKNNDTAMGVVKEIIPNFDDLKEIEKLNQFDIRIFLEGDILQKVDRLSMNSSLEVRSPFLDHRIVDMSLSMNIKNLISEGVGKLFLKKLLEEDFDSNFVYRDKIGFMLNVEEWRKEIIDLLKPMLYIIEKIDIIDNNINIENIETYTLFAILIFLVWYEEYMI